MAAIDSIVSIVSIAAIAPIEAMASAGRQPAFAAYSFLTEP